MCLAYGEKKYGKYLIKIDDFYNLLLFFLDRLLFNEPRKRIYSIELNLNIICIVILFQKQIVLLTGFFTDKKVNVKDT